MIPLIGILLCIYLVFKGIEIFQIAYCSSKQPAIGLALGFVAMIAGTIIAGIFAFLFISSAASVPIMP